MDHPGEFKSKPESTFNVVLFQPEIPQNTGNIGRTCVALGCKLWIVRPTGFRLDDSHLKRAGLDYWQYLDWEGVDCWSDLEAKLDPSRFWLFTKHATQPHTSQQYRAGDSLIFGSETAGLPESIRLKYQAQSIAIPMIGPVRSLNLAVSAGIGMYEAYRSIGQPKLNQANFH